MKYLKLFESYKEIESICNKYRIDDYTINSNGLIDVNGDVNISHNHLKELPLNFNIVNGHFNCSKNKLINLNGCPNVVNGTFNCSENKLTILEGSPKEVGKLFNCSYNELITLEGCPREINRNFYCNNNELISLEGGLVKVEGNFDCSYNKLTTLKGLPKEINGEIYCEYNQIISLEGISDKNKHGNLYIDNPIEILLDQIPKDKLKEFLKIYNDYNPIKGNIISKFKMDDLLDELNLTIDYNLLDNIYTIS